MLVSCIYIPHGLEELGALSPYTTLAESAIKMTYVEHDSCWTHQVLLADGVYLRKVGVYHVAAQSRCHNLPERPVPCRSGTVQSMIPHKDACSSTCVEMR